MTEFSYVIPGEVASKKNSRRIVRAGGRIVALTSKKYEAWERVARAVINTTGKPKEPLKAATVTILIRHGDMVKRDSNNATQGILDVLVDCGVIVDDNWMVVGSPDVHHYVDVEKPGMTVVVSEEEPTDYRKIFTEQRRKK